MTLASHVWSPRAPTLGPAAPAHGPHHAVHGRDPRAMGSTSHPCAPTRRPRLTWVGRGARRPLLGVCAFLTPPCWTTGALRARRGRCWSAPPSASRLRTKSARARASPSAAARATERSGATRSPHAAGAATTSSARRAQRVEGLGTASPARRPPRRWVRRTVWSACPRPHGACRRSRPLPPPPFARLEGAPPPR